MSHYDETTLLDYVAGLAPRAVAAHVAQCGDCGRSLDALLEEMEDEYAGTAPELPENLRSAAANVIEEEHNAESDLAKLLADPERRCDRPTAALVRALLRHIEEQLDRAPAVALELTNDAEILVPSVRSVPPAVGAELRGDVWRLRSHALRMLSRGDEALAALDIAAREYAGTAVPELHLANIHFSRAGIYANRERFADALDELATAEAVYGRFGDRRRLNRSLLVRGVIQYRTGNFAAARESFERVVRTSGDDADTAARALHNLSQALIETGELEQAAIQMYSAAALYEELGKPVEAARTRWGVAKLYLRSSQPRDAMPLLQATESAFRTSGMVEEAGLVILDIAQAALAQHQRNDARAAVRRALDLFLSSRLEKRAGEALRYLTEALDTSQAQPVLQYVRAYVEELRDDPGAIFAPPRT